MAEFELYKDQDNPQDFRWRLRANNGEIIADSGEGYNDKDDAEHGIDLVKQQAPTARVRVLAVGEAEPGSEQEADATRIRSRSYPPAEEPSSGESSLLLMPLPGPIRADEESVLRVGETRVTLDTVVSAHRLGEAAEGIAEQYPSLRLSDVYTVLDYYRANREAVDGYIAQREDEARQLRKTIEHDFDPTGLRARLLARRTGER